MDATTEPGTDLATVDTRTGELVERPAAQALVHGLSPAQRIGIAAEAASEAGKLIKAHGLTKRIQGRDYLVVEGWQLFAQSLDMTIICEHVDPLPDGNGWRATAVVRAADGREVGRGSTVVTRDEKRWKDAEEYAVMSMAQTRAIGRAARAALGYVAVAAGYEATPADEIPGDADPAPQSPAVPPWGMAADQEQLRDATAAALVAIGIDADDHAQYGRALLAAVKAATGGVLPAVAITLLRTVAETQEAFYADVKAARAAEDAAARDGQGEAVDAEPVTEGLPGITEPSDPDAPNSPYDVGA